mmetsp:Transcript_21624/g.31470  ORF Transcript_21624/g.31470 Transcript_21624/m.31470 type:complete len:238 (+) Transcript_21624:103-816(+)|eukprot:CAMPEP_0185028002 /NCGR_PEP_ID=MMETSP1103-20130426/13413_1 /TAXON_ID=36769 /ORGANISM="Paraphysomonas bandaiensis, Strain Caron Lab Isolate" /LENGTH=237 /DNA_ID=CAMNT_0027562227 /DNA_START=40 /DNA_END=753 /DNA_ORIENTATION=+
MDDGYLQFVMSLLDESEHNPALKRDIDEHDDFLPNHAEFFGVRDRAFSWDLGFEEQLHADAMVVADQRKTTYNRKRANSRIEMAKNNFDHEDKKVAMPVTQEQPFKMSYNDDAVATVQLESGSGVTTVMPTYTPPECVNPRPDNSDNFKIGAYTKLERRALIEKFRAKKKRRVWRKQIKYDCRKRLADTRPRVKGRFVSRKEKDLCSDADSESIHNGDMDALDMGTYDDDSVDSASS